MKTWQKVLFVVILVIFVAVSVTISLISISRAPYKFKQETAISGDETLNGWVFERFSGNASTKTLTIDFVRDKNGENPDETKPVVAIGAYAVNADEYAETLAIGASVRSIDKNAFFNLKKLQKVTVDPANEWFKDVDGVLFSKDGGTLLLYPVCYGQTPTGEKDGVTFPDAYTVPQGTRRIENFAFLKNAHLRDLTLPDTLREIGDMTFSAALGSVRMNTTPKAAHRSERAFRCRTASKRSAPTRFQNAAASPRCCICPPRCVRSGTTRFSAAPA